MVDRCCVAQIRSPRQNEKTAGVVLPAPPAVMSRQIETRLRYSNPPGVLIIEHCYPKMDSVKLRKSLNVCMVQPLSGRS
jgi:hypothetical protein